MSASTEPGSRSIARAPSETIPTGRSAWTTTTRRASHSRISAIASSTLWSGVSVRKIAARHLADRRRVRVAPVGDRANHDVAVGHESRRGAVLDHYDGADVVIAHDP